MHYERPYPPPRRIPIGLLLAVALVGMLVIAGILGWLAWQFTLLDPTVAGVLRVAVFVLLYGIPAGGAAVGLVAAYNRYARLSIVHEDKRAAFKRAEVQVAPLATNVHWHYQDSSRRELSDVVEGEVVPQLPPGVPSFNELLNRGAIGPNTPLILGYDAASGEPITGSWRDLYSCGIGGLQGSGKTWAAVYLLCQSALQGGRLVICDPHANDGESLAARIAPLQRAMLCDIADDDKSILAALKLADDKLQKRKRGHKARWPIVVAIDEFLSLRRGPLADLLPALIEDFSTEGRKLNCHVLLLSQRWDKAAIGDFRNTLASNYVYRMRREEARMMTGLPADGGLPDDTLNLAPGTCYLLDTSGTIRRVTIPTMTPADVARIAPLIPATVATEPIGFRPSFHPASIPLPAITAEATGKRPGSDLAEAASTASGSAGSASAEAVRAAALFRQNMSEKAIVKELRGVDGGRNYETARDDVRRLILEGLIHDNQ